MADKMKLSDLDLEKVMITLEPMIYMTDENDEFENADYECKFDVALKELMMQPLEGTIEPYNKMDIIAEAETEHFGEVFGKCTLYFAGYYEDGVLAYLDHHGNVSRYMYDDNEELYRAVEDFQDPYQVIYFDLRAGETIRGREMFEIEDYEEVEKITINAATGEPYTFVEVFDVEDEEEIEE